MEMTSDKLFYLFNQEENIINNMLIEKKRKREEIAYRVVTKLLGAVKIVSYLDITINFSML